MLNDIKYMTGNKLGIGFLIPVSACILLLLGACSDNVSQNDLPGSVQDAIPGDKEQELQSPLDSAKRFFERCMELGHNFDVAATECYSDEARIVNRRTYPTGQVREMEMTGAEYKKLIQKVMPLAALKNDRSQYNEIQLKAEGERVRLTATRFSERKQYSSPYSALLARKPNGEWTIVEEQSESRP